MNSYSAKIVSLVLLMTILTACSNSAVVTETTGESTTAFSEATETAETTAVETTEETTVETNVIDNFAVETSQYNAGFEYSIDARDDLYPIYIADYCYLFSLGYDNPELIQNIRDYYYSVNGNRDETLTAANVHSFQYGIVSTEQRNLGEIEAFSLEHGSIVRIILSRLELNYLIDEIPSWFFEEYFPEYRELFMGELDELVYFNENVVPEMVGDYDWQTLESFQSLSPEAKKLVIFVELLNYNMDRKSLIYNYYDGDPLNYIDDIIQVRDEETGRFVLVPTEEQYYTLITDLSQLETFENMDLIHPETEEELSEIFGISTEELIPYDMFGYESQTFSYVDGQVVRTLS